MKQGICAAYIRRELKRDLLLGPPVLIGSALFAWVEWSLGVLQDVRMLSLTVPMFLLLFAGGVYLISRGLVVLAWVERSDLCTFIRSELSSVERNLSGKEMIALVERDLSKAVPFADGKILIGTDWLFVSNAWGKPVLRLVHLHKVKSHKAKGGRVILKFMDAHGAGPATRELPTAEAGAIQAFLQRNAAMTP